MWHRFGQGFDKVILRASEKSDADGNGSLSTRHLLWALEAEANLPAAQLLTQMGIVSGALQSALAQMAPGETAQDGPDTMLTREARAVMDLAYHFAAQLDDQYVGGEHLLLALLCKPDSSDAGRALAHLGADWHGVNQALMAQQTWRTRTLEGAPARLRARRLKVRLRGKAGQIKRLAYGLSHYQKPFMPYVVFRKRNTDNPYPFYARLRAQPAYWDPMMGHWVITRYQDVVAALAEPCLSQRVFGSAAWSHDNLPPIVHREFRHLHSGLDRQMLFLDAPDQPRQRMLVAKRFTPRVIAQMQEQMQEIADELLDAVQASGQMDVLADLAVPFPLRVITRMLGLPLEDIAYFKKWSGDYFRYLTFETALAEEVAAYQSVREADTYFRALLPARRLHPQDDLITLLCQPGSDGEFLPDDEVIANCLLLLATGHENTTRLISSGLLALLRSPDQWKKLCADPSLAASAVEELLRYDSPVQWTLRHMEQDLDWHGHALKKGQKVQIGISAANRDPEQFPDADTLDITRAPNRHVAFGHGAHFCLGAALTRLEAQTVFRSLAARLPHLRLEQSPEWRQEGLAFRGLQTLRVRWNGEHKSQTLEGARS